MKITVKHKGTELTVEEMGSERTSLKWSDHKLAVKEILIVMTDQVKKLNE